ncbi:MAG TPA: hypothetical protein VFG25_03240 [Nitrosopumilaceae archaeon]|nr:hypothetical protein [Nitrosopumilaceae archaeon]
MPISNNKIEEIKEKMQKDLDDNGNKVPKSEVRKLVKKITK